MDDRQTAVALSAIRVGIGGALAVAPGLGRGWIGDVVERPGARVVLRSFGVRDAVLGAATLQAVQAGDPVRRLLVDGILVDAGDLLATVIGFRHLPRWRRYLVIATSATAVVVGARLLSSLE